MTTNETTLTKAQTALATYIGTEAAKIENEEDRAAFVVNFLTELENMAARLHTEIRKGA